MLRTIAAHSEVIELPAGPWQPRPEPEHCLFLDKGRLQLARPGQPPFYLDADQPAAAFPLPLDDTGWKALIPCRLLRVPTRYLELSRGASSRTETGIELTEDDAEADLYLECRDELKQGRFELPAMPELAVRIGKALDDPNTVNADIARLIQLDPALNARVMRVVNSAACAGRGRIGSLQQAVARLGRQQVRNLVFSCIIKDLFRTDSPVNLKSRIQALWRHSCRVAAISTILARLTPGLDPERALLAGLVHDIGAIPLLHAARNLPALQKAPGLLDHLIDDLKGEVGQLTLEHWHFDHELARVARHAEDWQRLGTAIPDYLDVVLLAQLHAAVGQGTGSRLPRIDQIPAFRRLALGRLTPRHSIAVLDEAKREIAEIEDLLHH
ncbi:signal transduction protein [endosymbiont of unidentified scaly snail isolate Monju]|nr:signal transduction protein [endosymbiont of unidentified scaly snail isolate Monju]